jgi:deoxyribonuclease IV
MPKIGVHISIAGGIINAPKRAADLSCEIFQCFTRPPQGGPATQITPSIAEEFRHEMKRRNIENFYIHTPYYINLSSLEPRIRHGSISVVRDELERGNVLGAKYVMTHLGSHTNQTLEEGLKKITDGIQKIFEGYAGETKLLIENSAGSGNIIGDTFDELSMITQVAKKFTRFGGICFDTCHAFASGYDFTTKESAKKILSEFDEKIGLEYLSLAHVNDSKFNLGEKKDRHEHIGQGFIKKEGIAAILNTPEFQKIDWILETEDEGREKDIEILKEIGGRPASPQRLL